MLQLRDLQSETLSSEPMAHQMSSSFVATVRDVRHRLLPAGHSASSTCFTCDKKPQIGKDLSVQGAFIGSKIDTWIVG